MGARQLRQGQRSSGGDACAACAGELPGAPALVGSDLLHGIEGEFGVLVCPACGAGNTRPPMGEAELGRFYPDSYGPHATGGPLEGALGRALVRREIRVGAAGALGAMAGGRLLDVGCGDGELAALLARRGGWRASGVEPSEAACERARSRGGEARAGTLADVAVEPGAYDAVLFNHSLEHIADPVGALEAARAALRPGGRVAVSVPDFGCWARRRFGADWFHLDLPRHRVHFTEAALRAALERAGLRPEGSWNSTSPSGLAGSIQYRRLGGLAVAAGPARHALGQVTALGLIPLARAEQALGGGRDYLHALARRP